MEKEPGKLGAIFRRLGPVSVMAVIASTLPAVGGLTLVGLIGYIGPWLKGLELAGVPLYLGSVILLTGFAVLPTYSLSLLGGWAFGLKIGSVAAIGGITGGATLAYFLARWISGERVISLLKEHPKWNAVYVTLLNSGFFKTLGIVTLIRLPAQSPFAITNLVLASTRVHPVAYILGTLVGLTPRTTVVVWVGSRLTKLKFDNAEEAWIFAGSVVVALAVLAIIGYLANRAVHSITNPNPSQLPPAT